MARYVICPRCELNFIDADEREYCEVCEKVFVNQEVVESSHSYVDNICGICGFNSDTNGFIFTLSDDGESYCVSGYNGTDTELVIPSTYNEKPVTSIGEQAFSFCDSLTNITIPECI